MIPANDTRNSSAVYFDGVWLLRDDRPILSDISWRVGAGEVAAILGPNGAGKSTMTRIMLGYLWPTRGHVAIAGQTFGETNLNDLRTIVRLVQPSGPFEVDPNLSVAEVVYTGIEGTLGLFHEVDSAYRDAVTEMVERVGLHQVRRSAYHTLSTGERVRAQVARALIGRPRVLILDEPTAGLDIRGREELLAVVDALEHADNPPAIVMVTHHVEELPRATSNVLLLGDGAVAAQGKPAEVLRGEVLSNVYQCDVDVRTVDGRYYLHATGKPWVG